MVIHRDSFRLQPNCDARSAQMSSAMPDKATIRGCIDFYNSSPVSFHFDSINQYAQDSFMRNPQEWRFPVGAKRETQGDNNFVSIVARQGFSDFLQEVRR